MSVALAIKRRCFKRYVASAVLQNGTSFGEDSDMNVQATGISASQGSASVVRMLCAGE